MMATINVCDICGSKENISRIYFIYDRTMDASGSRSDDYEIFDLCEKHQLHIYNDFIEEKFPRGEALYEVNRYLIDRTKTLMRRSQK